MKGLQPPGGILKPGRKWTRGLKSQPSSVISSAVSCSNSLTKEATSTDPRSSSSSSAACCTGCVCCCTGCGGASGPCQVTPGTKAMSTQATSLQPSTMHLHLQQATSVATCDTLSQSAQRPPHKLCNKPPPKARKQQSPPRSPLHAPQPLAP